LINAVYSVLERLENIDYLVVETTIFAPAGGIPDDLAHADFPLPVKSKYKVNLCRWKEPKKLFILARQWEHLTS